MATLNVVVDRNFAEGPVAEFADEIHRIGLALEVERVERGLQASVWLFIPTALVILFTKPFFESIAKKAGEECYPHLKVALAKLVKSLCEIKITIIGKQPDKLSNQFSLAVSFYFPIDRTTNVKFLIRNSLDEPQYDRCVEEMLKLLHQHEESTDSELHKLLPNTPHKRLILLDFDLDTNKWRLFDPPSAALALS